MKTGNIATREPIPARRRSIARQRGLTYVEVLVTVVVLSILSAAVIPIAKTGMRRQKEIELRQGLRKIRTAIDQYKEFCDNGLIQKEGIDSECYPPSLEVLVEGVSQVGTIDKKLKFLRRVPKDPFSNSEEWGMRSYQDDHDSTSWGRQNVYDVYTEFDGTALDGTEYQAW